MKSLLFTPDLQKAVSSGRKTQTRRIIPAHDLSSDADMEDPQIINYLINARAKYKVGDIFYMREGFRVHSMFDKLSPKCIEAGPVEFKTGGTINCIGDHIQSPGRWRSPLHLPEKLARTFLQIKNVRVEKLRDISDKDCLAEGIKTEVDALETIYYKDYENNRMEFPFSPHMSFRSLWIHLFGNTEWYCNPWVFVYEFELCDRE